MSGLLLHILPRPDWQAAVGRGEYRPESLAREGFIHCSTSTQVLRVANEYYRGREDLLLLVIDPGKLGSPLRWEPGTDAPGEMFPHLYGPLNLDAVDRALAFAAGPDGRFQLPEGLA